MANNFTLGSAWVDIRARDGGLKSDVESIAGKGLAGLKGLAKEIKGAVRPAHAVASAATGSQGLAGIGALFGPEGALAGAILDGVLSIAAKAYDITMSTVGKFNPAAVERFNQAWDDLYAVIGQQLAPVVDLFTETVKLAADIVKEFVEFNPLLQAVKSVVTLTASAFRYLRESLESLGLASASGAAARSAQISSTGDYLRRTVLAVAGGSGSAADKTAANTEKMVYYLEQMARAAAVPEAALNVGQAMALGFLTA